MFSGSSLLRQHWNENSRLSDGVILCLLTSLTPTSKRELITYARGLIGNLLDWNELQSCSQM